MILVYCGSRQNQVTAGTIAIQKLCANIAYEDDAAADTKWVGRGRGEKQEDLRRGPISKLHTCKIGDWVQNNITETLDQAADLSVRSECTTYSVSRV